MIPWIEVDFVHRAGTTRTLAVMFSARTSVNVPTGMIPPWGVQTQGRRLEDERAPWDAAVRSETRRRRIR